MTTMKHYFTLIFILFLGGLTFGQEKFTISGTIKETVKGEELINAVVKVKGQNLGARSNEYGFFSLTLEKGKYTLVITNLGYVSQEKEIDLSQSLSIDFNLSPEKSDKMQDLNEVKVSGIKQDLIPLFYSIKK